MVERAGARGGAGSTRRSRALRSRTGGWLERRGVVRTTPEAASRSRRARPAMIERRGAPGVDAGVDRRRRRERIERGHGRGRPGSREGDRREILVELRGRIRALGIRAQSRTWLFAPPPGERAALRRMRCLGGSRPRARAPGRAAAIVVLATPRGDLGGGILHRVVLGNGSRVRAASTFNARRSIAEPSNDRHSDGAARCNLENLPGPPSGSGRALPHGGGTHDWRLRGAPRGSATFRSRTPGPLRRQGPGFFLPRTR